MKSCKLWVVVVILAVNIGALAQTQPDLENGFKHWGSYDSSHLDTVNLQNGNLMLHAPLLPGYLQRGKFGLQDVLSFNSKTWQVVCQSDPTTPNSTICGWVSGGTGVALQRSVDLAIQRTDEVYNSGTGIQAYTSRDYTLISPDGATHQLAVLAYGPPPQFETASPTEMETVDTTGYHVTMSGADMNGVPNIATVTDRHGNQYVATFQPFGGGFNMCPAIGTLPTNHLPPVGLGGGLIEPIIDDAPMGTLDCPQLQGAYKVTDSNGNFMNLFDPAGVGTGADTLGKVLPLESGSPAPDNSGCPAASPGYGPWLMNYSAPDGTTRQLKMCYTNLAIQTAFNVSLPNGSGSTPVVESPNSIVMPKPALAPNALLPLSAVVLADGTSWTFIYDGYGEISNVTLPTGGSIGYTWTTVSQSTATASCISLYTHWSRAVATRTLNDGLGHSSTWLYTWGTPVNGLVTNKVTDPLGNDTAHTFTALDGPNGCSFYETSTQYYQGAQSPANLVKKVDTTYYPVGSFTTPSGDNVATNVVPKDITTTLYPSLKISGIHREYDTGLGAGLPIFGNVKKEFQYDWGQGAPGPLLRETDTTYQWEVNSAYLTAHLLDLPASVIVYDGAHTKAAETDYVYDEPAYLTGTTITTQHTTPPAAVRGNLTSVNRWLNTTNSFIASHTNWYDTGEPFQQVDPLGHTTTHSYDPFYMGAYSTQTCSPATGTVQHCVSGTYDFNTGALTSLTNENATSQASGNTPGDQAHTSNFSYDYMFRITSAQAPPDPANGSARAQTGFSFSAPNAFPLTVTRSRSITNALSDSATATFDGLARNYKTQHLTPGGNATVDTTFDVAGRVATVSNPYFTTTDPTYGLTQTAYDALDRAIQVTKQDGGMSTVAYTDNCTTSTDEAGKQRKSCSDVLGRLVEVDEPNPGAAATSATGSVTVNGTEQAANSQPSLAASVTVTIGGADNTNSNTVCISTCHTITAQDAGTMQFTVTAGGTTVGPVSVSYIGTSTTASLAAALYSSFPANSVVTMSNPNGGSAFMLTATTAGSAANSYVITTSAATNCVDSDTVACGGVGWTMTLAGPNLPPTNASAANFSGGQNASTAPDSGTVTITVNGTGYTTTYGVTDTNGTIASRLATLVSAGSFANASASGGTVNLTSKTAGGAFNYSLSAAYTWDTAQFVRASFTTSASGTALSGGLDASGISNNPYITLYSYDALGNLLCVEQHGAVSGAGCSAPPASDATSPWRVRRFTYDSLSRLMTAKNPESGTVTYTYDNDGNLLQKTSPAPNQTGTATQIVSYCYDALHRVTGKGYGVQSCPLATPVVTYTYDAGVNAKGHLSSLTDQAGTASYTFDTLGRTLTQSRKIGTITKTVSYTYNLDGSIKTVTYPSGATVTYAPWQSGSVAVSVPGSAVDAVNNINYVTGAGGSGSYASYGPDLALTGFVNGKTATFAGIANIFSYNKRLQPVDMTAQLPSAAKVFSLTYDFQLGTQDNGNVYGITNNKDTTRNQSFTYDQLNRLTSAQNAGTTCATTVLGGKTKFWGNSYGYDPWGNLLSKTVTKCSAENLSVIVDGANRLQGGYLYDAAGNMTHDAISGLNYTYDAENRISAVGTTTYTYDADGNRVKKATGSTGTLYWYAAPGIVAESNLSGTIQQEYVFFGGKRVARRSSVAPTGVFYYFSDHLNTASVITDSAGVIKAESDYFPWGGELQFVNSDSNHYKFTGKERDTESGLDYFEARYYENAIGRFITPDPLGGHHEDPQTLNKYNYVRNNPTTLTDPTGLDFYLQCTQTKDNASTCQGGHQGTTTTDANGQNSFTPTVVTSASLQDPKSGNTATVNENGVMITTNGQTSQGVFINNTPSADINGSGKLQDFSFHIDSSDEKKGTLSAGEFKYNGNRDQTRDTLDKRGAYRSVMDRRFLFGKSPDELKYHPNSTQHRFGTGPSPHLSVPDNPKDTVPTQGGFHVDRDAAGMKHLGCATLGVGCN